MIRALCNAFAIRIQGRFLRPGAEEEGGQRRPYLWRGALLQQPSVNVFFLSFKIPVSHSAVVQVHHISLVMMSEGRRDDDAVLYNVSAYRPRFTGSRALSQGAACLALELKSVFAKCSMSTIANGVLTQHFCFRRLGSVYKSWAALPVLDSNVHHKAA